MMLHNQDEIAEFDEKLGEILKELDSKANAEIFESVRALMAKLFFHDFAEWSQKNGRWVVPEFCLEAFDSDEEQRVRSVVSACITILKTNGRTGVSVLLKTGREYLRNRGVDSSPVIVSVNEIAAIIEIEPKNIPQAKKAEWGDPIRKGTRGRPATYNRAKILPKLEDQWPDKPWWKL